MRPKRCTAVATTFNVPGTPTAWPLVEAGVNPWLLPSGLVNSLVSAPASAASGCDTATTPPRKPGPGGTARPEASCDAQAGAKPGTAKASTSSDLRMSGPRSQPAVARIAACAAGIRVRLLDLRQVVARVLRKRVVGRCPARLELEDPLELRRDAALVVPGHRGVALVFMVAVVVIVPAAAVAVVMMAAAAVAIIVVVVLAL